MNSQICDTTRLSSFVRGALSAEAELELTEHLDECEACGQALEREVAEASAWREASELLGDGRLRELDAQLSAGEPLESQIQHVLSQLFPTDDPDSLGRLGGYEITGVIGSGGMGVVLKAREHSLDRIVALKVMAPHLAASGSARQRFAREAKAAAAVLHPNVIAIHGVSNQQPLPYLVMPYVQGRSLQKRIDAEGPLPLVDILRIGMQVAAGLAAAHEQGLVHRDIKPGNVLMEQGVERVTITDFGLARAVDDASMTRSGVIAGTPQYMSPEQARGEQIDARSDLFSLGSLLYAMCTGRSPFRAETSFGVLHRITRDAPRPIREVNPDIPLWLEGIVMKLLSKDAVDRFQPAEEVAEILEACLSHTQRPATTPLPQAVVELAAKSSRKGWWLKFVAASLLLWGILFAGVLIVLEWNKGTLRIESDVDDVPIRIVQGEDIVEQLIVSRSGKVLRVAAGSYEVEIGGAMDGVLVSNSSVVLRRGGDDIVRIVKLNDDELDVAAAADSNGLRIATTRLQFEAHPQDEIVLQVGESKHNKLLEWTSTVTKMGPYTVTVTDEMVRHDDGTWGPGFTFKTEGAQGAASTSYIAMAEGGPLPKGKFHLYRYGENTLLDLKAPVKIGEIEFSDGTKAPVGVFARAANDTLVALPVRVESEESPADRSAEASPINFADKRSPFTKVRFEEGDRIMVDFDGKSYEWLSIDDLEVAKLVVVAKSSYGDSWQKRIAEDLVEVLTMVGKRPGDEVALTLRNLATGEIENIAGAPMTTANRWEIYRRRNPGEDSNQSQRKGTVEDLTQIVKALHRYHELHGRFPTSTILGKDGKAGPPHSWRVELLPLLGHQDLYDQYHFDETWDSTHNKSLLAKIPDVYRSPLAASLSTNASYFGVVSNDVSKRAAELQEMRDQLDAGLEATAEQSLKLEPEGASQPQYEQYTPEATVFWKNRGASYRDMLDGTSNCIAVVEAQRDIPWTKPLDIEYSEDQPLPDFGGWFDEGVHAAFADGTVKFLANYNDTQTIRRLLTISDGKSVEPLLVRRLRIHGATAVSGSEPEVALGPETYQVPGGPLLQIRPEQKSVITEADILEVSAASDPGDDIISLTLTEEAGRRFLEVTPRLSESGTQRYMVFTFDREVLCAPRVILGPIEKRLMLAGDMDAKAIAEQIRAAMRELVIPKRSEDLSGRGESSESIAEHVEGFAVQEANKPSRNAREVIENYVALALQGEIAQAASLAKGLPARENSIAELAEFVNRQRLQIETVYVSGSEEPGQALATSEPIQLEEKHRQPNGNREGRMVFTLESSEGQWLVKDIDFETPAGASEELYRFLDAHPNSIGLPPQVKRP